MAFAYKKQLYQSAVLIPFALLLFLLSYASISLGQTPLPGFLNESVPVQQFIMSAPEEVTLEDGNIAPPNPAPNPLVAPAATMPQPPSFAPSPVAQPAQPPITDDQGFPIFPTKPPDTPAQPSAFPGPEETTSTLGITDTTRTPIPLSTLEFFQPGEDPTTASITSEFAGGVNDSNFIKCARMAAGVCSAASNDADFQKCLSRLKRQPACEQFLAFAALSSFARNDEVDLVQYYKEGQLLLIHVVRLGESYPGDYYTIGANGDFMNITGGNAIKGINITRDLRYPEIASRYPKAQIWSVVDQLPVATASPDGGLRLIFRFAVLNGCVTCDKAGYANVAYDFSGAGVPQRVSLLSLDPILAQPQ